MEKAITSKNEIVYASELDVGHGNYFCTECRGKVHWREIPGRATHFYHDYHDEAYKCCSLSSKSISPFDSFINDSIRILRIINYRERWIGTINDMIQHGILRYLNGKEWALNPLEHYIDKLYPSINIDIFLKLLSVITTINNERADNLIYKYLGSTYLNQNDKKRLLEYALKNSRIIDIKTFDTIVGNVDLNNTKLFEIIYKKLDHLGYKLLLSQKRYENLIYASELLKHYSKSCNENSIYLEYLEIKSNNYNHWSENDRRFFFKILVREIKLINKKTDMIKLFEKDLSELNKTTFDKDGIPIIKIKPNGKIKIRGEVIEINDIDIYKEFKTRETSIGGNMLKKQFPENNYSKLTIHSHNLEENKKNSYDVFISKREYNKLGLKKGATIISVIESDEFMKIKYWNCKTIKKTDK
jgi:hypothetical protein